MVFISNLIFLLCLSGGDVKAPLAPKEPYEITAHGDKRIDYYYWMRDRDSKKVLDYLKMENRYTDFFMRDYKDVERKIFKELKGMLKDEDETPKVKYKNYMYFKRYRKGDEFPIYLREDIRSLKIEKILDVNLVAKGRSYCDLKSPKVSPDENLLAYAVDFKGRRFYTIYIKDLKDKRGKKYIRKIENVTSNFVWGSDSKSIYYVKQDSQTLRWFEVYRYDVDRGVSDLIYREDDETFSVYLTKSMSERYVFVNSESTLTTEVRYIDLEKDGAKLEIFRERERGLEYSVEDGGSVFFVRHNFNAKNFKISVVSKSADTSDLSSWVDFISHRDDVFIDDYDVFDGFIAVFERKNALLNLRIISKDRSYDRYISFPDEVYLITPGDNMEYRTTRYRYGYESPITPPSIYDYDVEGSTSILVKRKEFPGYDPNLYDVKRIWVNSRDGVNIPVTVVSKKNSIGDKVLLYGYGAYGDSFDPYFDFTIFPLINRGFSYAIAHIRGGSEMGRDWYENGRLLNKMNTFNDFIDVSRYLKENGYGKNGFFANGGSAGGLLMGVVANIAGDLYDGIVAEVPFVDCLTTMLDETIPLTTSEYDEWGDPRIEKYYHYIKSYSPYDNIERKPYPSILITAAYYDSQVQYWEPAKWAAKLREHNTSNSVILLKTDMSAGHSGKSGRYKSLKDIAFKYAFILKIAKER